LGLRKQQQLRVALAVNMVPPYRVGLFAELAASEGWNLILFVDAATEHGRHWDEAKPGTVSRRTRGLSIRRARWHDQPRPYEETRTIHFPLSLPFQLAWARPDVVVSSETGPRTALAALYCWVFRRPCIAWFYSTPALAHGSSHRQARLLRRMNAIVGMGAATRAALQNVGIEATKIFDAPNAADTDLVEEVKRDSTGLERARQELAEIAGGRRVVVVVGSLIPRKAPLELLEVWADLPAALRSEWKLLFIGSGPLEIEIRAHAADAALAGWRTPRDALLLTAAADLHVLPTLADTWGLVVNEAMALGTPTVASVHAAATADLIRDGSNGFVFDVTAPAATETLMAALGHTDLDSIAYAATTTASTFTPQAMAAGFRSAVDYVLRRE